MDEFDEKVLLWIDLLKYITTESIKMHSFLVDRMLLDEFKEWQQHKS